MRHNHHGCGGSRHIGRVRIRLAEIISRDLGVDCQPENLRPATGSWRTDKRLDVYCWEVFAKTKSGLPFVAGCWDSMTACVKAGAVEYDGDGEIYPKQKQE